MWFFEISGFFVKTDPPLPFFTGPWCLCFGIPCRTLEILETPLLLSMAVAAPQLEARHLANLAWAFTTSAVPAAAAAAAWGKVAEAFAERVGEANVQEMGEMVCKKWQEKLEKTIYYYLL